MRKEALQQLISSYATEHQKINNSLNGVFSSNSRNSNQSILSFFLTHAIAFAISYGVYYVFGPLWVLFASWGILGISAFIHDLNDHTTLGITNVRLNFIQNELGLLAGIRLQQAEEDAIK